MTTTTSGFAVRATATDRPLLQATRAVLIAAAGVGVGLAVAHYLPPVEAEAVARLCRVFSGRTLAFDTGFWIDVGTPRTMGFEIGSGCTAAILLLPLLLCATVLLIVRAARLPRLLLAFGASSLLVIVVNLLRIVANAWVARTYGAGTAFTVTHVFIGSLVSIALAAVACWLFLRLSLPGKRAGRPGGTTSSRRKVGDPTRSEGGTRE